MDTLSINFWDGEMRKKIETLQWDMAQRLLELDNNVIIEWGTWGRSERDILRSRARALGAAVELHYLTAPVDVLFERVQRRKREDPPITKDMMVQSFAAFQVPTDEEFALFDKPIFSTDDG